MSAEPSTSLAATVADESEEIKAEATAASVTPAPENQSTPAPASASIKEDGDRAPSASVEEEKKVDPNAIPEDACVTLYIQNLNEKVRIPGMSPLIIYLKHTSTSFFVEERRDGRLMTL